MLQPCHHDYGGKAQLRGFILIDAKDLGAAIRVATKISPVCLGSVEVWPIWAHKQLWPRRADSVSERMNVHKGETWQRKFS
jgi:hypothetical protein